MYLFIVVKVEQGGLKGQVPCKWNACGSPVRDKLVVLLNVKSNVVDPYGMPVVCV